MAIPFTILSVYLYAYPQLYVFIFEQSILDINCFFGVLLTGKRGLIQNFWGQMDSFGYLCEPRVRLIEVEAH